MITTTLFSEEEIYDDEKKSRIFSDEILGKNFQPTDVAVCTGAKTGMFFTVKHGINDPYGVRIRYCSILTKESLEDLTTNKWMNDCEQGLYPCFRFSDVRELVNDLGVRELEDYKRN